MLAAHDEPAEGFDSTICQWHKGMLHGHAHGRFGRRTFFFHSLQVAASLPIACGGAYETSAAARITAAPRADG